MYTWPPTGPTDNDLFPVRSLIDQFNTRNISPLELSPTVLRLWSDGDTTAGVRIISEHGAVIVTEEVTYEPSGEVAASDDQLAPFVSHGEQYIVDINEGVVTARIFFAEEGTIQGLVYALNRLRSGGPLSPEDYLRFIEELPADIRHDSAAHTCPISLELARLVLHKPE